MEADLADNSIVEILNKLVEDVANNLLECESTYSPVRTKPEFISHAEEVNICNAPLHSSNIAEQNNLNDTVCLKNSFVEDINFPIVDSTSQPNHSDAFDDVTSTKNVEGNSDKGSDSRHFYLLDEIGNSDEDANSETFDDDFDSDFDESEIDEMLEEGFKTSIAKKDIPKADEVEKKPECQDSVVKQKTVIIPKDLNHFEVLPDDWISVSHKSGMPIYLHRKARVCTLGKPYYIGAGSARNHAVPLSAVPCLSYKRALETEATRTAGITINGVSVPEPKVMSTEENDQETRLDHLELNEYASKLFKFREINVTRFYSWKAKRVYHKTQRKKQQSSLPEGSKLITCPIKNPVSRKKSEWILNPSGKTYICILHEYVQRVLKKMPIYNFFELENAAAPYMVTISISGLEYGRGVGASKKLAKLEAAKNALNVLIPNMKDKIPEDPKMSGRADRNKHLADLAFFDAIKIEDPRVEEFCTKTTEPVPHAILLTCLQRNFGMGERNIECKMSRIRHGKSVFTMTFGSHEASVECVNKRDGKQLASQALLKILHPHIESWGSLLRLYGNTSMKSFNEKKVEEQEITSLQIKRNCHGPNLAILAKLREEMLKISKAKESMQPIGMFVPPVDIKLPTSSTSDLCNLPM